MPYRDPIWNSINSQISSGFNQLWQAATSELFMTPPVVIASRLTKLLFSKWFSVYFNMEINNLQRRVGLTCSDPDKHLLQHSQQFKLCNWFKNV